MGEPGSFTDIAFETGIIAERERIIKLLETELTEFKYIPTDVHGNFRLTLHFLIALIKGENK